MNRLQTTPEVAAPQVGAGLVPPTAATLDRVRGALRQVFPERLTAVVRFPAPDHVEMDVLLARRVGGAAIERRSQELLHLLGTSEPRLRGALWDHTPATWTQFLGGTWRGIWLHHRGLVVDGDARPFAEAARTTTAVLPAIEAERALVASTRALLTSQVVPVLCAPDWIRAASDALVDATLIHGGAFSVERTRRLEAVPQAAAGSAVGQSTLEWSQRGRQDALPGSPAAIYGALREPLVRLLRIAIAQRARMSDVTEGEVPGLALRGRLRRWLGDRRSQHERRALPALLWCLIARRRDADDPAPLSMGCQKLLHAGGPALTHPRWEKVVEEALRLT